MCVHVYIQQATSKLYTCACTCTYSVYMYIFSIHVCTCTCMYLCCWHCLCTSNWFDGFDNASSVECLCLLNFCYSSSFQTTCQRTVSLQTLRNGVSVCVCTCVYACMYVCICVCVAENLSRGIPCKQLLFYVSMCVCVSAKKATV